MGCSCYVGDLVWEGSDIDRATPSSFFIYTEFYRIVELFYYFPTMEAQGLTEKLATINLRKCSLLSYSHGGGEWTFLYKKGFLV